MTFLTSALGQVPFPTAFIVLGKAWGLEENGSRVPSNNKIFNRNLGGAGRFSVVWQVKTLCGVLKALFLQCCGPVTREGGEISRVFKKQEGKIPGNALFKLWPQGFNFTLPVTHSLTLALLSFLGKEVRKESNPSSVHLSSTDRVPLCTVEELLGLEGAVHQPGRFRAGNLCIGRRLLIIPGFLWIRDSLCKAWSSSSSPSS